ncbi:MAG: hypothetical protein ACO1RT_07455 [Planctomycetaceae bacterium]
MSRLMTGCSILGQISLVATYSSPVRAGRGPGGARPGQASFAGSDQGVNVGAPTIHNELA